MTKFSPSFLWHHWNLQYGRRWSLQYGAWFGSATGTRAPAREHSHESTRTRAPAREHPHESTRTRAPAREHPHESTRTRAPAREHPHESTRTRTLAREHPHESTQMHPSAPTIFGSWSMKYESNLWPNYFCIIFMVLMVCFK